MATNYYYIATPFGDLEQPCWRLVEAEVGGADAIVFSLRLRGMAAQAGRGGLISLHDGTPMRIDQICSVLGYTPQRVHRSLEILHRHRLAEAAVGGGIRLLDPLLLQHLHALEAPKGPKSAADRAREYRRRHKAVTQTVTKPRDGAVTQHPQDTDIYCKYTRHETSHIHNIEENSKTTTPVVVDDLVLKAQILLSAWPAAAPAVTAVTDALLQHGSDYAAAQISYAKSNSKANPAAYLTRSLVNDYAGFYAAAKVKALSVEKKQTLAAVEAERQAVEDASLPNVTPTECFNSILALGGKK